jgi:hypothetical protein
MTRKDREVILRNYNCFKLFIFYIRTYYLNKNRLPQSIDELCQFSPTNYPDVMKDVWGNHFIIEAGKNDDGIFVKCLGQDKQEGGHEINGDWIYKISIQYDKVKNSSVANGTIISIPNETKFYFDKDKTFWNHCY